MLAAALLTAAQAAQAMVSKPVLNVPQAASLSVVLESSDNSRLVECIEGLPTTVAPRAVLIERLKFHLAG